MILMDGFRENLNNSSADKVVPTYGVLVLIVSVAVFERGYELISLIFEKDAPIPLLYLKASYE